MEKIKRHDCEATASEIIKIESFHSELKEITGKLLTCFRDHWTVLRSL